MSSPPAQTQAMRAASAQGPHTNASSALRVLLSLGTRPEAIKLAPVALAARAMQEINIEILSLGQHERACDDVLRFFGLHADLPHTIMRHRQSLASLSARCLLTVERVIRSSAPDLVLVQGDTTSAAMTALAGFYAQIPVWHVEAGLRTSTPNSPFPEETNRRLISRLASFHFAPTAAARANLLEEGVNPCAIAVTGNTAVDALHAALARRRSFVDQMLSSFVDSERQLLLVTMHRRENWGAPLRRVCEAVTGLVARHPNLQVVYAAHPNPDLHRAVALALGEHPRILVTQPIDYGDFVLLLSKATVVLTDSGGIQEEAPSLGVPVLVAREESERTEGLRRGIAQLVGTDAASIVRASEPFLRGTKSRAQPIPNPYGDGLAAERIVAKILESRSHGFGMAAPTHIDTQDEKPAIDAVLLA